MAMGHEVVRGDGQKGVGRNHAVRAADDAETVIVGVIGQNEAIIGSLTGNGRHDVCRRAVHADLAVVVVIHKGELRIVRIVNKRQVQMVAFGNTVPVIHARTAEGIDQNGKSGIADGFHVKDGRQFSDI